MPFVIDGFCLNTRKEPYRIVIFRQRTHLCPPADDAQLCVPLPPVHSSTTHTHLAADSCSSRSDKRAAVHGSLSRGRPLITSRYFYPILSPFPCHTSRDPPLF